MFRKRFALIAGALLIALVAAGCSKNEETNAGQTSQASATGAESTTSPTEAVSPTGTTTINIGGGGLPSGFPSSFPIPDGAQAVYSLGGTDGYWVAFSSSQSADELRSFFHDNLQANGWTLTSEANVNTSTGTGTVYTIDGNGFTGGVYLGEGAAGAGEYAGEYAFVVVLSPK
jgi:hypothetical protein